MRDGRRAVGVSAVMALSLLVAGCNIWPFSLFSRKPSAYGVSWAFVGMGQSLPARMAHSGGRPGAVAFAQATGINDYPRAIGIFVPERSPFSSGARLGFYAWKDTGSGRQPVSADWSLAPDTLGKPSAGSGPTFAVEPTGVGPGRVTAVVEGNTVTLDVQIYPGFMLDNGTEYSSDLDPSVGADRGQIGFDFGLGMYTFTREDADLYIAADLGLVAPGGAVAVNARHLEEVTVPNMDGASTRLGSGERWPVGVPSPFYVLRTRSGRPVALQFLSFWGTCQAWRRTGDWCPGYRAYAFGYRML